MVMIDNGPSTGSSGCFGLRRRRSGHDLQSDASVASMEEYTMMKQKLISQPDQPSRNLHFTERDLRTDFKTDSMGALQKTKQTARKIHTNYVANASWWARLCKRSLPIISSVKNYKKSYIFVDIAAGLSVGIASIPMGMSYALLAGLPPAHGLYNNLFFPFFYMFLGTGRQVCVGTSAIEAMLSFEAVTHVLGEGDVPYEAWLNASIGLALMVGICLTVFRILGLGVIANFLADPVLSGFSTGSALTIATSQLKDMFGMNIPRMSTFSTWIYVLSHLGETHWGCVIVTVSGIILLWLSKVANKKWFKRFPLPGSLFVIAIFVLIGFLMKIDQAPYNVKVVGGIPRGLPSPMVFNFDSEIFWPVLQQALLYSIMFFVIHISIAKTIAQQRGYVLDANQEFLAVGLSGLFGSFFQTFPIATSVSRSSIANVVGAETTLYHLTNCAIVLLTVTVITPLLYYLPKAALASVVLFGVYFMMYFSEAWRLLKLFSWDFVLWAACCITTVVWGPMEGVVVSVVLSLLWLLKKSAFPNTVILGRLPGTMVFRNIDRFPMAVEIPGCKIFRFDASINFSNADQFDSKVSVLAQLDADKEGYEMKEGEVEVKVIIIDASSVNDIDVTAFRMLRTLARRVQASGRVMLFANWKGPMRDYLDRSGFYTVVKSEHCFLSLMDAVLWAETFYLKPADLTDIQMKVDGTGNIPVNDENGHKASFHVVTESAVDGPERKWTVVSHPQPQ